MPRLDTTILGGLPVTVEISIARAEPDVGIFSDYVEDWCIVAVNGKYRQSKFHRMLEKKALAKEREIETRFFEEYSA